MSTENTSGAPPRATRAHACFRLDAVAPLDLTADRDAFELWRRLSYRLLREPGDLLAHSRRVLLCRRAALRERLPGALLDLDHAAAGRGRALRHRLLEAVKPCLEPQESARFELMLDSSWAGSRAGSDPMPALGRVLPSMVTAQRELHAAATTAP